MGLAEGLLKKGSGFSAWRVGSVQGVQTPPEASQGLESPSKTVDGHLRAVLLCFSIRHTRDNVCVCVCVCVRERERERDQERD